MNRIKLLLSAILLAFFALVPSMTARADANLIANPSFETSAAGLPSNWAKEAWGTNTPTYTYENTGHTGSHSATVQLANYQSGEARWILDPVPVTANTSYSFSDWYKSTIASSIDAVVTATDGSVKYVWVGDLVSSASWKQFSATFKAPANAKTVSFYHYINANGSLTTDDFVLTAPGVVTPPPTTPPTAPTVQLTAPANNATVSGTQSVTATATDTKGMSSVQFQLDGANLGAADTKAPYSVSWNTKTVGNGAHTLTAVARNTSGLTTTATPVAVTVNNADATTVAVSAPAANATVAGSQTVTAVTGGTKRITSVQFKLDGANLGTADTTAPYSTAWNTVTATNGAHTLTAVATNNSNIVTTSAGIAVTVNNVATPPTDPNPPAATNLIQNPSVEASTSGQPTGWSDGSWGNNTYTVTYENTGHTGSHSLKTTVTSFTDGDAKWMFDPVTVTPGASYAYSSWYKSNVDTKIDAKVTLNDGTVQYYYVTLALSSSNNWAQTHAQFVAPQNAKSISFFQVIEKVGYVQTDDFNMTQYSPAPFNRALVSVTFDDGWDSQYTNGLPLLNQYGLNATFYIISGGIGDSTSMNAAMLQALKNRGDEIASHTVDHPHLPTLTAAQIDQELGGSQATLRTLLGTTGVADNFATPYGEYNTDVINAAKKYYRSHRSVEEGFNDKDSFDPYNIKTYLVVDSTTPEQIAGWVAHAQATHTWLVLTYHIVDTLPNTGVENYAVTPANLSAELNIIKQSGVAVKTVSQALDEIQTQL